MPDPVCPRCLGTDPGTPAGDPDHPYIGPLTREVCIACDASARDEISEAFDAGNYANAYETTDLDTCEIDEMSKIYRAAFVLGFFGSYSLDEIGSDREIFDECYWSPAGQYVVKVAGYCDDRADEYAAMIDDFTHKDDSK